MSDGTTHYAGCSESGPKHYKCALLEIARLRDALSRLVEVHDAMGGKCGTVRIAAEEALAKGEGK